MDTNTHRNQISPPDQGLGKGWGLLLPGTRGGTEKVVLRSSGNPLALCLSFSICALPEYSSWMPSPRDSAEAPLLPSPEPAAIRRCQFRPGWARPCKLEVLVRGATLSSVPKGRKAGNWSRLGLAACVPAWAPQPGLEPKRCKGAGPQSFAIAQVRARGRQGGGGSCGPSSQLPEAAQPKSGRSAGSRGEDFQER